MGLFGCFSGSSHDGTREETKIGETQPKHEQAQQALIATLQARIAQQDAELTARAEEQAALQREQKELKGELRVLKAAAAAAATNTVSIATNTPRDSSAGSLLQSTSEHAVNGSQHQLAAPMAVSQSEEGRQLAVENASLRQQLATVVQQNADLQERLLALAFTPPAEEATRARTQSPDRSRRSASDARQARHVPLAENKAIQRRVLQAAAQRSIQRELFDSEGLVGTPGTSDSAKPVTDGLDTQESPQLVAAA